MSVKFNLVVKQMTSVPNGVEILPKILIACRVGHTNVTDDDIYW